MMEITQYVVYVAAAGFPIFFILRWLYSQWWKANLPAFWAWVLQQRRRDKTIRETRERVDDIEQWLTELEHNRNKDEINENQVDMLDRLVHMERLLAQMRHRLRQKGIMIDG